jgi:hypothetical protein
LLKGIEVLAEKDNIVGHFINSFGHPAFNHKDCSENSFGHPAFNRKNCV